MGIIITRESLLALEDFADVFSDRYLLSDIAKSFTCREAEAFVGLFEALGMSGAAKTFLESHAEGDYDCEDMHHVPGDCCKEVSSDGDQD